jgi:hypothetical protein
VADRILRAATSLLIESLALGKITAIGIHEPEASSSGRKGISAEFFVLCASSRAEPPRHHPARGRAQATGAAAGDASACRIGLVGAEDGLTKIRGRGRHIGTE